jgi:hypothetical protein
MMWWWTPKPKPKPDPGPGPQANVFRVLIPENVNPGEEFQAYAGDRIVRVCCPSNSRPGQWVSITVPVDNNVEDRPPPPTEPTDPKPTHPEPNVPKPKDESTQLFEVEVPRGVQPGQPFALMAGGQRVLVTCPENALPGQRIRFKLPIELLNRPKATNEAAKIKLKYDKDGWTRTVRLTDMKFQWVRMDDKVRSSIINVSFLPFSYSQMPSFFLG